MAGNVTSQPAGETLLIELQEAWEGFDDTGELTVSDLAEKIELIANNHYDNPLADTLKTAIEAFREEERYDRELAGRGGHGRCRRKPISVYKIHLIRRKTQ